MKYLLLLLVVTNSYCFAQITTRKMAAPAMSPDAAKFDSSRNFLEEKPWGYIGQELYVQPKTESLRQFGYEGFVLDYKGEYLDKGNVYLCCDRFNSKYADLNGKYFSVAEVIKHPEAEQKPYLYGKKYYLKLIRKDNQDVVYYAYDGQFEHSFPFLTVGFFEKQKKRVVGQKFVFCNECIGSEVDINTGKPIAKIPGQKWVCTDLTIEEKYYRLVLICQNQKGEQIDMGYDSVFGKYREGRTYTEREADAYLKRFGVENFSRILDGKVKIGMTKEMCRLSWGEPNDINETITAGKRTEQWVYKSHYLYFDNGILTVMQ